MCDFSQNLIAWLDRELPESEAADLEQHLQFCAECKEKLKLYEEVIGAFAAYRAAAATSGQVRRPSAAVRVLSGMAAVTALLLLVLRVSHIQKSPIHTEQATRVPPTVTNTAMGSVAPARKIVARRHGVAIAKTEPANWMPAQPAIEISIPAEAMFPPGAVPDGINFTADVKIAADGSAEQIVLRP